MVVLHTNARPLSHKPTYLLAVLKIQIIFKDWFFQFYDFWCSLCLLKTRRCNMDWVETRVWVIK